MSEPLSCQAVAAIDQLLADQPDKVGADFSAATRSLVAWRNALALRWRHSTTKEDRQAVDCVNAALSVILGGQFPLGSVQWSEIKKVQRDLAELARAQMDPPA